MTKIWGLKKMNREGSALWIMECTTLCFRQNPSVAHNDRMEWTTMCPSWPNSFPLSLLLTRSLRLCCCRSNSSGDVSGCGSVMWEHFLNLFQEGYGSLFDKGTSIKQVSKIFGILDLSPLSASSLNLPYRALVPCPHLGIPPASPSQCGRT